MVNEIQVCVDELILQVFEDENSYSFSFPLETQKDARSFVKALHSKGVPYEQISEEIEEREHNFSAWRKGLGRPGIGNRVIQRINDPIQEIFDSTDDEEETDGEEENHSKEVTKNGSTHVEQVTLNSNKVTSKTPSPEPFYPEKTSDPEPEPQNLFKPLHVNTQEKDEESVKIQPSKSEPISPLSLSKETSPREMSPKETSPKAVSPKQVSPTPAAQKQVSPKGDTPKQVSPRGTDSSGSGSISPKSPRKVSTPPEQEPENGELINSPLFRRQSLRRAQGEKKKVEIMEARINSARRTPSPTKEPSTDSPFGPRITRSSSVRSHTRPREVTPKESPFGSLKLRKTGNKKALVDMSFTQDLPATRTSKTSGKSDGNPEKLSPSEKKGLFEAKMASSENLPTRVSPKKELEKSPDFPIKPKAVNPSKTSPKKELENKPARISPKKELENKPARTSPKKELENKPARISPKKELENKPARTSPKKELETKQDPPPSHAFIRLTSTENKEAKNQVAPEASRVHIHHLTSKEDTKADIKAKLFGNQSKKVIINENYNSDADEEEMDEEVKNAYAVFKKAADKKRSSAGFIYVLTDSLPKSSKQRVKIGASRYPEKRLEQAQCLNLHVQLVCSIKVEDRKSALDQVLSGLDEYKVPGTTDWFKAPMNTIRHVVDSVSVDDSVC